MALLRNKQKMDSPTIGFLKRFRLRLSIVSQHSANAELQIVRRSGSALVGKMEILK